MVPLLLLALAHLFSLWHTVSPDEMQPIDYQAIGMTFQVPADWEEVGPLILVSKAEYARKKGEQYAGADSSAAIYGLGLLVTTRVDSTRLPAPDAFEYHVVQVRMEGFHGWYGRFLWSLGRKTIMQSFPHHPPGVLWSEEEVLSDNDPRNLFPDGYGMAYSYQKMDADIAVQGQIYYLIRGERCYQIMVEGVKSHYEANWPVYERVLRSMRFEDQQGS
ncbi:MAG: hypothetical protein R2834_18655 [Rhodothermales bacterium]